jgi:DNA polymerase-3 subunit delta'
MSIIGHKAQRQFLWEMSQRKRVPQAMIFFGQDSLGKKRVALEFIKFLYCKAQEQGKNEKGRESCQNCLHCELIEKNQHPDFTLLVPEKKEIYISQIRDLQKTLNLRPQISGFRSVIIDDAETLNWQAQNCLLKTLEEPHPGTLLILITSKIEALFETIRSRCQVLKFYPVSFDDVAESQNEILKNEKFNSGLGKIFLFSRGEPGKIINFLKAPQKFSLLLENFQQIEKLLTANLFERFCFSQNFFKKEISPEDLYSFLDIFENYLRLIFLKKIGAENKIEGLLSCQKFWRVESFDLQIIENYSIVEIKKAVDLIENLKNLILTTNLNLKLTFENFLIHVLPRNH